MSIVDKVRLEGEYASSLTFGGVKEFMKEIKWLLGSPQVFNSDSSVVEGRTGNNNKQELK